MKQVVFCLLMLFSMCCFSQVITVTDGETQSKESIDVDSPSFNDFLFLEAQEVPPEIDLHIGLSYPILEYHSVEYLENDFIEIEIGLDKPITIPITSSINSITDVDFKSLSSFLIDYGEYIELEDSLRLISLRENKIDPGEKEGSGFQYNNSIAIASN